MSDPAEDANIHSDSDFPPSVWFIWERDNDCYRGPCFSLQEARDEAECFLQNADEDSYACFVARYDLVQSELRISAVLPDPEDDRRAEKSL